MALTANTNNGIIKLSQNEVIIRFLRKSQISEVDMSKKNKKMDELEKYDEFGGNGGNAVQSGYNGYGAYDSPYGGLPYGGADPYASQEVILCKTTLNFKISFCSRNY